ncbi:uncharacterized protein LOC125894812 isoform X2 [Xyrichtys novacula]|uniref:Uncharacterized protein LOC125894812 isoform X2 n=1 Tax=Xyrichtys novacula TaxID=13765 RepID=A0AAV1ETR0_XYRNO|nr:uncharacterized protein LOC125894812 isoform X2 [Xyrichtys novacula]
MGETYSKEDYDRFALDYYATAQGHTCILPDVGVDESLLKYSGLDSNAVLQAFSKLQVGIVPGYVERLGSRLAPFTSVPNAVGLGALVLSMIMEICIKSLPQTDKSYEMFRRVFGEEKASSVRDTMSEYLRRHRTFINDNERLKEELKRLEAQLSNHLTILRNSLLHDGQMSTRGFKIWVNGASFHIQMLLHEARLNIQAGKHQSEYVHTITAAIDLYLMDMDRLLAEYKTYKLSDTKIYPHGICYYMYSCFNSCYIKNSELNCRVEHYQKPDQPCGPDGLNEAFMNVIFSQYEPIAGLKSHFVNLKNNVPDLINQHAAFILPT